MRKMSTSTPEVRAQLAAIRLLLFGGGLEALFADGRLQDRRLLRYLPLTHDILDAPSPALVHKALSSRLGTLAGIAKKLPRRAPLFRNLTWLGDCMGLDVLEQDIVLMVALASDSDVLGRTLELLGPLRLQEVIHVVAVALDVPEGDVTQALSPNGKLLRSGLLWVAPELNLRWECKLGLLHGLAEQLVVEQSDPALLLRSNLRRAEPGTLVLGDFCHLNPGLEIAQRLLGGAQTDGQVGVNILLVGPAGTGKTSLAGALATELGLNLYEVAVQNRFGNPLHGEARLGAMALAQEILGGDDRNLLVLDEAEGVFRGGTDDEEPGSRRRSYGPTKARVNQLLETNRVPTLWLTNSLAGMDPAFLRRFSFVLQVPVPPRSVRARLLNEATEGLGLSPTWQQFASAHEGLSPAQIHRVADVVQKVCGEGGDLRPDEVATATLNGQFRALDLRLLQDVPPTTTPLFRPDLANADTDLLALVQGLRESGRGTICCFGEPGTGKSAFGRYLADALDRPLLLKRGSDLISKWVGGTERAIAQAFEEAHRDGAVLQFDEVDSLLGRRERAQHSWEVTQVNELLCQLEAFDGILVATSNRMESQDKAALRRFDLKINFRPLLADQQEALLEEFLKGIGLEATVLARRHVRNLVNVAPGDFAAVFRQHRFCPVRDAEDFVGRLAKELTFKRHPGGRPIGFGGGA
jgi:SpoVK/Ycf46/Vps4 family AAA+-type ATPase